MTREQIEEQIMDAKTTIAHTELQLKLPKNEREGEKHGRDLVLERNQARKRVKELEKWIASGFFEGRGGGRTGGSSSQREVTR